MNTAAVGPQLAYLAGMYWHLDPACARSTACTVQAPDLGTLEARLRRLEQGPCPNGCALPALLQVGDGGGRARATVLLSCPQWTADPLACSCAQIAALRPDATCHLDGAGHVLCVLTLRKVGIRNVGLRSTFLMHPLPPEVAAGVDDAFLAAAAVLHRSERAPAYQARDDSWYGPAPDFAAIALLAGALRGGPAPHPAPGRVPARADRRVA